MTTIINIIIIEKIKNYEFDLNDKIKNYKNFDRRAKKTIRNKKKKD
jgi:hypothetical protein